mgnify:CR=1 FL=1
MIPAQSNRHPHPTSAPEIGWEPLPLEWVESDGIVRLMVAKGTLVPLSEIYATRAHPRPTLGPRLTHPPPVAALHRPAA